MDSFIDLVKKPFITAVKYIIDDKYVLLGHPAKKYNSSKGTGVVYIYKKIEDSYEYFGTIESNLPNDNGFGNSINVDSEYISIDSKSNNSLILDINEYMMHKYNALSRLADSFNIHPYQIKYLNEVIQAHSVKTFKWNKNVLCLYDTRVDTLEVFDFDINRRISFGCNDIINIIKFGISDDRKVIVITNSCATITSKIFNKNEFGEWILIKSINSEFISFIDDVSILFKGGIMFDLMNSEG